MNSILSGDLKWIMELLVQYFKIKSQIGDYIVLI